MARRICPVYREKRGRRRPLNSRKEVAYRCGRGGGMEKEQISKRWAVTEKHLKLFPDEAITLCFARELERTGSLAYPI